MRIFITRRCAFSASHILGRPGQSEAENIKEFGPCANPHGHGHNYVVEVTLRGDITRAQGYFLNFHEFSSILKKEILPLLDHKNLTKELPFFKDCPATCENIACFIWEHLEDKFPGCALHRVMVKETENNWAEYFGEENDDRSPAFTPGSVD